MATLRPVAAAMAKMANISVTITVDYMTCHPGKLNAPGAWADPNQGCSGAESIGKVVGSGFYNGYCVLINHSSWPQDPYTPNGNLLLGIV